MEAMFSLATNFNQDITGWDVSSVDTMEGMFFGAASFRQDLCPWGPKMLARRPVVDLMFIGAISCAALGTPNYNRDPPSPICFNCL